MFPCCIFVLSLLPGRSFIFIRIGPFTLQIQSLETNALYLSGNENLITIKNKGFSNTGLYKITDATDFKNKMILTEIFVFGIVPLLILSIFLFQLIYRKLKIKKDYEIIFGKKDVKNEK